MGAYPAFYAALSKEVTEKGWDRAYFTDVVSLRFVNDVVLARRGIASTDEIGDSGTRVRSSEGCDFGCGGLGIVSPYA